MMHTLTLTLVHECTRMLAHTQVDTKEHETYQLISQLLPVLALLGLLNILPLLFTLHSRFYEQRRALSQVLLSV